jgi:hypothetical protein
MDRLGHGAGRDRRPVGAPIAGATLNRMTRSVWFWLGAMAVWGAVVGVADKLAGLSYGIELLLIGVGVAVVLNLSHRHAGVPR